MLVTQKINQKQGQELILSQKLRQSVEILSLSNQELVKRIEEELLGNPLLQIEESAQDEHRLDEAELSLTNTIKDSKIQAIDKVGLMLREDPDYNWYQSGTNYDALSKTERKDNYIQNAISVEQSLGENLLAQMRVSSLNYQEQLIAELIISAIEEETGLLRYSLEELSQELAEESADNKKPSVSRRRINQFAHVLSVIQGFEPIGCGAHDIKEALLIQTRHYRPDDKLSTLLIKEYLPELNKLNFKKIEKELKITSAEIQKALHFIQSLEVYPARLYTKPRQQYIVPEIIIEKKDEELEIYLSHDDYLPKLKISEIYKSMLGNNPSHPDHSSKVKQEDKKYLKNKLEAAQLLLDSIQMRKKTLLRVATKILEYQKDFFLKGPGNLRPLILAKIAKGLDLHESTISRAIASKYLQCSWGYYELKYFFSPKLKKSARLFPSSTSKDAKLSTEKATSRPAINKEIRENEMTSIASQNIKERMRYLLEQNEASTALSDQNLADIFREEGIEIARRTVSKYRKIMGIPSVNKRRKIKMLSR